MSFSCQNIRETKYFRRWASWLIAKCTLKRNSSVGDHKLFNKVWYFCINLLARKSILNPTHWIGSAASILARFGFAWVEYIWIKHWSVTGNRFFREVWTLVSHCKECRLFFLAFQRDSRTRGRWKKCYRLQKLKPHLAFEFKSRKINAIFFYSVNPQIFAQYRCTFDPIAS